MTATAICIDHERPGGGRNRLKARSPILLHTESRGVIYNRIVNSNSTFARGTVVLVTLREPREKFWGAVLEITTAGVGVSGINLAAFDDFASQLRDGEPASPSVVFFPMHRVERVELDVANGEIPSLRQRFLSKCGCPAEIVLMPDAEQEP